MYSVKSLRALKAAGLILAAVALGLMTVQGSYALWNATVNTAPSTVQAADFSILVNGVDMRGTQVQLPIGELARGKTAYAAIEIRNNVNVTAASPLQLGFDLTLVPADNFGGNLVVKTFVPVPGGTCPPPAAAPYKEAPNGISRALALGATQNICVAVELNAATPTAQLGKAIQIPANLTVTQLAPGTQVTPRG